jgi:hypothetical protein
VSLRNGGTLGPFSRIVADALERLGVELERHPGFEGMSAEEQRAAFADLLNARRALGQAAEVIERLVSFRR